MEIQNYRDCKNSNVEMSGYLFFSNDPRFISRMILRNTNFIIFRDINQKKILKGIFNTIEGRNGYCEDIDYNSERITIKCGLYKNNILKKNTEKVYEQLLIENKKKFDHNWFAEKNGKEIQLEMKIIKKRLIDIYTPDSIPYWSYHPENMRKRDKLKWNPEYLCGYELCD